MKHRAIGNTIRLLQELKGGCEGPKGKGLRLNLPPDGSLLLGRIFQGKRKRPGRGERLIQMGKALIDLRGLVEFIMIAKVIHLTPLTKGSRGLLLIICSLNKHFIDLFQDSGQLLEYVQKDTRRTMKSVSKNIQRGNHS